MTSGVSEPVNEIIDVNRLVAELTVEELCETAEKYFAAIVDPEYHLIKPFAEPNEAAAILSHFAAMIATLRLESGLRLLDFGSGTCWTSRYFAQMGMKVTACDVSPSALAIGKEILRRTPIIGDRPPIEFAIFDGRELAFPDGAFDRIAIMDAFHHIPNQDEVLSELYRVLDAPGRIVMAEPGPEHSKSEQSQHEMRNFTVVEQDIDVLKISEIAKNCGFHDAYVGIYSGLPFLAAAGAFEAELAKGDMAAHAARHHLTNHRLIVLDKHANSTLTSRNSQLCAEINVEYQGSLNFVVTVRNISKATWLGTSASVGVVNLGLHRLASDGTVLDLDYGRFVLRRDGRPVLPGETCQVEVSLPNKPDFGAFLEFDLVSEGVAWFAEHGSSTVRIAFEQL